MKAKRGLSGKRQKTILIVDDHTLIVSLLAWDIQHTIPTSRVVTASNGAEGLRMAKQIRPDVIVADLMMPEMDGFEMVESIRRESPGQSIPVIGITSSEESGARTTAFRGLCDEFLAKPFNNDKLIQDLRSWHPE
jgi:CheY-like chemotaxis protein